MHMRFNLFSLLFRCRGRLRLTASRVDSCGSLPCVSANVSERAVDGGVAALAAAVMASEH